MQTDRRTDMTKLIAAFLSFAKVHNDTMNCEYVRTSGTSSLETSMASEPARAT